MTRFLVLLMLLLLGSPALAQDKPVATASSPGGVVSVSLYLDGDGRPSYTVTRSGKPVLDRSRLGFLFTDQVKIERNQKFISARERDEDSSWQQPWGEWQTIRNRFHELAVRFGDAGAPGRVYDVVFRLYDDGVGFRYEFPEQAALPRANIAEELTEFAFAQDGTAWWKPAFLWNREEYLVEKTALSALGTADTPVTIKLADGTHVALHEAALVDYSGMAVARAGDDAARRAHPRRGPAQGGAHRRVAHAVAHAHHRR